MKLVKATVVCAVLFVALLAFAFWSFVTPSPEEPDAPWVEHYKASDKISSHSSFDAFDREAKLVLAEADKYGGKMPPAEKMSADQKFVERMLWWFPLLQDRGETLTYAQALDELGKQYQREKKWDDAEKFYRTSYNLELAEYKAKPKYPGRPSAERLIKVLHEGGKTKQALELQEAEIAEAELVSAKNNHAAYYEEPLLRQKTTNFEMQGKIDEAERCMLQLVDLDKIDLTPERIADAKRQNSNINPHTGGGISPRIIYKLECLAEFYKRHKNDEKEEETLRKIMSFKQSIWPENYSSLSDDWDPLIKFYKVHEKLPQAEDALLQQIKCREEEDTWEELADVYERDHKYEKALECYEKCIPMLETEKSKPGDFATVYFRQSKLLKKLGKDSESEKMKAKALAIDPGMRDSYRGWP